MPNTYNAHSQAAAGVELRGWEYRKFADVAAMNLVTGRPGEICTVTATGADYHWNTVEARWIQWSEGPLSQNLVANAHFEYDSDVDGLADRWNVLASTTVVHTVSLDTADRLTGAHSQRLENTSSLNPRLFQQISVESGVPHVLRARVRSTAGTLQMRVGISTSDTSLANVAIISDDTWRTVQARFTPATASIFVTFFLVGSTASVIHVDSVALVAGVAVPPTWQEPPAYTAAGPTTSRPVLTARDQGFTYFDTTIACLMWWSGTAWLGGYLSGTTASRPTGVATGTAYFDTTINAPVWWNGTAWVDAVAGAPPFNGSFTGDGSAVTFTVTHNLGLASPFQPSSVSLVSPTGEYLGPGAVTVNALATNTFNVVFGAAPAIGETYTVRVVA